MTTATAPAAPVSVDPAEVEKFSALAAQWWDPDGQFAVLHKFNPVRLAYIREHVCAHFDRALDARFPMSRLRILDVGCGGGLLCEPMARLGATVTGIDPSEKNIKTAIVHAGELGLDIDYQATSAEALAARGEQFDVVLNMEVVEHVRTPELFILRCAEMVRPGGLMFTATLNRTLRSFALAIIGAEYVLGWLPRGTHQWEKFLTPEELERMLAAGDMRPRDLTGVTYNPLTGEWSRSEDTTVNYMVLSAKPATG